MDYLDIIALRNEMDDQKRGYLFETAIREFVPWHFRPPITVSASSEQFDGYFEWNGRMFLVEAKAKNQDKKKITPGSHDWEDFELKVRKRHGQVVGVFFSLYPLPKSIFDEAESLNRQGLPVMIYDGHFFDSASNSNLPFEEIFRYTAQFLLISFESYPSNLVKVRKWLEGRVDLDLKLDKLKSDISGSFLRRYAHLRHEDLYVDREIDGHFRNSIELLKPNSLKKKYRERVIDGKKVDVLLDSPKQVILFRDKSGSGKTTFSVNVLKSEGICIPLGKAAREEGADAIADSISRLEINSKFALDTLKLLDKPIAYLVDSLDEATTRPSLGSEISGIFSFLEVANTAARELGLRCYPILIIFTVRDEYWRDFERYFEGRQEVKKFVNICSVYSRDEFSRALKNYKKVYSFITPENFEKTAYETLSSPFNLAIFSETNRFCTIENEDLVLIDNVLQMFFNRKRENVIKRPIAGFSDKAFMECCSIVAFKSLVRGRSWFTRGELGEDIAEATAFPGFTCDEIAIFLISEQIIEPESERNGFTLRHTRFLEYLCAYYFVIQVQRTGDYEFLDKNLDFISKSHIISPLEVNGIVLFLARLEFPSVAKIIEDFYVQSTPFMGRFLLSLRSGIAAGNMPSLDHISMIIKGSGIEDPEISWNSFFAVAAVNSKQSANIVFKTFELAWRRNKGNPSRWKMLPKLLYHELLLFDKTVRYLEQDYVAREWEVFLGLGLRVDALKLNSLIESVIDRSVLGLKICLEDQDWRAVSYMLKCIDDGILYESGKCLSEY